MKLHEVTDPQRPPDWRYRNAEALIDSGLASPSGLDLDTRRLVRLLKSLRCATTDQERVRALDRDPVTARALELSRPGESTGRSLKLRLLTGAQDVAKKLNLSPSVVSAFVSCHFDISGRLDDVTFIFPQVVFCADHGHSDSQAFERLIAYLGGPEALDEVLHLGGRREGINLDGLANSIASRMERLRGLKINLAMESVDPMDLKATPEAVRLLDSSEQAAIAKDEKTPPRSPLEETVAVVLSGIQWAVRGTKNAQVDPRLQPFEGGHAELRADDQVRIAAGEDLYDPEEFKNRKLPPPRDRKAAKRGG